MQQGQQGGGELDPAAIAQELLSAGPTAVIDLLSALEDLLGEKGVKLSDLVGEISSARSKGQQEEEEEEEEEEPQGIGPGESDVPMNAPPAPGTRQRLSLR